MQMRIPIFALLALSMCLTPASAQTYGNTSFPVCLQVFGRLSHIDCSYVSIEQCRPLAVARAAQCITNPYYAPRGAAPRARRHRYHGYR
jgi:hypothetical protein